MGCHEHYVSLDVPGAKQNTREMHGLQTRKLQNLQMTNLLAAWRHGSKQVHLKKVWEADKKQEKKHTKTVTSLIGILV